MRVTFTEKGLGLVERMLPTINILDSMALINYHNWRTDGSDYRSMLRFAKQILKSGVVFSIDSQSAGLNGQTIMAGTIKTSGCFQVDYSAILERAVDAAYQKLQKQIPNNAEQKKIVRQYLKDSDNTAYKFQFEALREKLHSLNKDIIRERLNDKLNKYLLEKGGF